MCATYPDFAPIINTMFRMYGEQVGIEKSIYVSIYFVHLFDSFLLPVYYFRARSSIMI